MSNPFMALDLSDDENITVVKPAEAAKPAAKPVHVTRKDPHFGTKTNQPRKELKKEEENLQTKKRGPAGPRGQVAQPSDVAHPGERSKIGLKKEEHVNTHKLGEGQPRRGRQFDRHSGTGRGREIKKGGGGGHNWGKEGEDVPAAAATPDLEAGAAAAKDEEPAPVEEDPSLTLEEYEKLRAQKRVGEAFQEKPVLKVTAEPTGKVYRKGEEGDDDYIKLGNDDQDIKKKSGHIKNKAKQVFEIDFKVKDTSAEAPRRGRPEGGRGGGSRGGFSREDGGAPRGGRGGGAPRGGRGGSAGRGERGDRGEGRGGAAGSRIDTADQSAFPKLGGSA